MKQATLALALLFAACSGPDPDTGPPDAQVELDAGVRHLDAAAPPPQNTGCNMGNLPLARTQTFTNADPVASAVLNELQDMVVADRRPAFGTQFFPTCWSASGTAPTLVINPGTGPAIEVWKIPTGQTVRTRIPYEGGVSSVSYTFDIFGDGAVDFVANILWEPDMSGSGGFTVTSNGAGANNVPGSWSKYGGMAAPNATTLTADGILELDLIVSGGTFLWIGGIYPHFTR